MEDYLNSYLTLENAVLPKDIQSKIGAAPPPPLSAILRKDSKRRKNNSLNFEEAGHNININLEINNYSIVGKPVKARNNYHSQEKEKEVRDFYAFQDTYENTPSGVKKNKMEGVTKSQLEPKKWEDAEGLKLIEKIKSVKLSKLTVKDVGSPERKEHKKKGKLRRSEMEMHERHDKHPIRFNTEANEEWCEGPKLKKGMAGKSKLLASSKSNLRLHKNAKD
jgi:hypothetical protein